MIAGSLWLAQVVLFIAGLIGPWRDAPELKSNGRLARPVRLLLSASLAGAALLLWLRAGGTLAVYAQWVAFGMVIAFIGDLVMAKIIPFPNRLIGGMLVFSIAYGLYALAFGHMMQTASAVEPYQRWTTGLVLGLVFYGLLMALGWWFLIRNPEKGTVLNVGALVYGSWISLMAALGLALAVALGGGFWLTALGGLFLVSSDLIIGMTNIRGIQPKNANDWVWLTYLAGQMGIIYASVVG